MSFGGDARAAYLSDPDWTEEQEDDWDVDGDVWQVVIDTRTGIAVGMWLRVGTNHPIPRHALIDYLADGGEL